MTPQDYTNLKKEIEQLECSLGFSNECIKTTIKIKREGWLIRATDEVTGKTATHFFKMLGVRP